MIKDKPSYEDVFRERFERREPLHRQEPRADGPTARLMASAGTLTYEQAVARAAAERDVWERRQRQRRESSRRSRQRKLRERGEQV